jgi:hypothetical protein
MRLPTRATAAPLLLLATVLSVAPGPTRAAPAPTGLQKDVVFSDYSPLSASTELLRRLVSPRTAAQALAHATGPVAPQSIDLTAERFLLYVPAAAPAEGYSLLVFVPPWQEAVRLPAGWAAVLDHYGMIYVSAARSGNDESTIGRREPLALLAAYNVMQRYPVNAARVYVGGFSGGARIALRLAVAYPDLFRGVLLNAGSDPLGNAGPPLPPAELFRRFQESSRLVYVTGERDTARQLMDDESLHSMRKWCVFDVDGQITPGVGHEVASAGALSQALRALLIHTAPDAAKLARCRAEIDRELNGELQKAQTLISAGKHGEADQLLKEIDRRFGGLAAPRSLELAAPHD